MQTSLLLAILGNLPLGGGTRSLKGRVAYVPQRPWIRGDTVRSNILMGEKLYRERYSEVLRVCALQKVGNNIQAHRHNSGHMIYYLGFQMSGCECSEWIDPMCDQCEGVT